MDKTAEEIDKIAKVQLESAANFDGGVQVASIYGVKAAMLDYYQSRLSELKEQVEGMYGDSMAHPQTAEGGHNEAIEAVLNLIEQMQEP